MAKSYFERNYMCNPRAEVENAIFTPNAIENCYDKGAGFTSKNFGGQVFIGGDFAIASGPTADWDCYIVAEKLADRVIIKHGEVHRGVSIEGKVQRLLQLNEMYNPQQFILDESTVGIAVIEDLRMKGVPVEAQSFHPKARNSLLTNLKRLIDNGQISIPRNKQDMRAMAFTDKLISELLGVKEASSMGVTNYVTTTPHDDTVMALALSCKRAVFRKEFVDSIASSS
jgi:hypothetical protein